MREEGRTGEGEKEPMERRGCVERTKWQGEELRVNLVEDSNVAL